MRMHMYVHVSILHVQIIPICVYVLGIVMDVHMYTCAFGWSRRVHLVYTYVMGITLETQFITLM
jgi:hypothetical protein